MQKDVLLLFAAKNTNMKGSICMATRVSKPEPESFDRTPYIFERTRVDDMGESITETFYSVAGRKQEFLFT